MKSDTPRFKVPLYTIAEAARIEDVPPTTLETWAKGYTRRPVGRSSVSGDPIITYLAPQRSRAPSIPFIGLSEALVLAAFRRSGVPMQRIRPAIRVLQESLGIEHALASKKLYTDGAEVLFDYGNPKRDSAEGRAALRLIVARSGQHVFTEVIESYLQRIEYGSDGYAALIYLPAYRRRSVIADPRRAYGAPIFSQGGAPVDEVLQRFLAGESVRDVSRDFGVPQADIEEALRASSRRAA